MSKKEEIEQKLKEKINTRISYNSDLKEVSVDIRCGRKLIASCEFLLKELDIYAKSLGYKYAVGTIHPDNVYSINNLLKDNFKLIGTKKFTRGLRNIYIKDLRG